MHAKPAAAAAVAAIAAALGVTALAGCTADRPEVELSQAVAGTPAPTQTVTVTELITPTVTTTVTQTLTTTATMTVTALPRPSLTATTTFNQSLATLDYTNLIDDVRVLDGMPATGAPTALQLEVLARHLASLRANGAPPGIDPPSYYSRIGSLQLFAEAASDEAAAGSPQAAGRYAVIRQETSVLLSLVNGALRSTYALPAPATRAPATPVPSTTGTSPAAR
ncbi:hypothetical protein [Humibacillus xanthopallidus]|uniref:hypothetical protein n=1 Tax=Humibacillus xanthopallidus TaxID=412689 RepID=UPI00384C9CB0